VLLSVYIKRNLCGRAEFQSKINPITVEFRSSSTHPSTTTFTLATYFTFNHTQPHVNEPLPSLEGCGLKFKHLSSLGNAASAPPLSRGMWAAEVPSTEKRGTKDDDDASDDENTTVTTAPNLELPPTRTLPLSRGKWVSFFTLGGRL
jgi:hypothetical protein